MRQLRTANSHLAEAAIAAALMAAGSPAPAWAGTLVAGPMAAPTGACTTADPCDLAAAVRTAAPGDDVTVLGGTYDLTGRPTVSIRSDIAVHGQPGQPRPTLIGDHPAGVLQLESPHAVLRHVAIDGVTTVGKGLRVADGMAEDVVVHVTAPMADACDLDGGLLRNSVCWASGAARSGLHMHAELADLAATVIGSTIVGPVGIRLKVLPGRVGTLRVDSSIILGSTGGPDIETKEHGEHHVVTSSCNFDSISGRGITAVGGQSAAPALVDPANGDFHQLPGSPTVDAGGAGGGESGAFDIDGDPRVIGAAMDIGADELPAAGAPAVAAPSGASGAPAPSVPRGAERAPAVWAVTVVPGVLRGRAQAARVRFTVDRAALVRIRVVAIKGRVAVASALVRAKAGTNALALPHRRALARGRYHVIIKPTGGSPVVTAFSVLPSRRVSSAPRRSRAGAR